MRVLIPGISGVLGHMVAHRLLAEGHEVIGIDKRPWPDAPPGVEMHHVDIRKRAAEDVFRKRRPQAVIHMATVTHLVARTEERYRINLGGTRAVFEHAVAYGVEHAIFVGRHTYYGAGPDSPLYHHEDDPPMAVTTFPELSDLVAADLYACTSLWRFPDLVTTVLRFCYTLGPTGHGTLATFLKGPRVPSVLGFDPLYQFMHGARRRQRHRPRPSRPGYAESTTSPAPSPSPQPPHPRRRPPPDPHPRRSFSHNLLGRFGLPKLPKGALAHIKYPVVIDAAPFRKATGFAHEVSETQAISEYRSAFPPQARLPRRLTRLTPPDPPHAPSSPADPVPVLGRAAARMEGN
ncbi:MAG: NAD-dependent epimerase/dehydratase family protein [Polyangiaceae bacterium]